LHVRIFVSFEVVYRCLLGEPEKKKTKGFGIGPLGTEILTQENSNMMH